MRCLIIFFGILIGGLSYGQENKIIYYDASWKVISSENGASFYREIEEPKKKADHFIVKDFYITGELQMKAEYASMEPEIKYGQATFYYKEGPKQSERFFVNGKESGDYKEWYPNSHVKAEGQMKSAKKEGDWKYYYSNGKLRMDGNYLDDNKNGDWKIYTISGQYYLKYSYEKGLLIKVELLDDSNGYVEYFTDANEGEHSLTPYIGFNTPSEYKVTEELIRKNIKLLQSSTDFSVRSILYPFTLIWLTNCPYLGRFEVNVSKFMIDYTQKIDQSYKYHSFMTQMYTLGLAAYFFENAGNIKDKVAFHESGALFMINYYQALKKIDSKSTCIEMEELVKIKAKNKLNTFIKKY